MRKIHLTYYRLLGSVMSVSSNGSYCNPSLENRKEQEMLDVALAILQDRRSQADRIRAASRVHKERTITLGRYRLTLSTNDREDSA
jgi:hypothetical protein